MNPAGSMIELRERIAGLSPEKRKQLELFLRQRAGKPQPQSTIPRCGDGPQRLSFAQERLWFIEQLEPAEGAYNLAWALRLRGALNVDALQQALDAIVLRHTALRTVFREADGVPYQFVDLARSVQVRRLDLSGDPSNEKLNTALSSEAHQSFDLSHDLLLRAFLVRLGQDEHVLLLTLHHIAADGWSRGILLRELGDYYGAFAAGETLHPADLPIEYVDFAQWQRQWLYEGPQEQQLAYWKERLAGTPATLDLPADFPRPGIQTYHGAREILRIDGDLPEKLHAFSRQENVTLFMILLAVFETLLYRYTGESDIVVGTPVANRQRVETENLIGYFVNTVAMRTDCSGEPSFRELLSRVRETTLGAYAHQDVPFEKVIDVLKPLRQRSHSPIFQVLFVLLNAPRETFRAPGLSTEIVEVETGATQFDLVVEIVERPEEMILRLAYRTDLFEASTARRMLGHFQTLLRAAVETPDEKISRLPLLTGPEHQQLLTGWNQTACDYPRGSAYEWFERQAAKTPDAIAVAQDSREWTYAELKRGADRVASRLQKLGANPGALVAICVERSLEMIAGLLGIWKAGAAYLPLDPNYPKQRLSFIVEDARPAVILTELHLRDSFSNATIPVAWLDDFFRETSASLVEPNRRSTSDDLAYVLYTSGSTGKPKGVAIRHGALTNLLSSMSRVLGVTPNDTLLAVTTISFDIAGLELFLPLVNGARVAIVSREIASDGSQLARAMETSGATIMQATPATWEMLLDVGWSPRADIKMICGGEAMPAGLADRLKTNGLFWNVYGPTETTIWSTVSKVDANDTRITIGRPLDNTELYVLDRQRQSVPIGVPGELYIGGAGLAEGYWDHPELTAERFIEHSFQGGAPIRLYRTGDLVRYLPDGNVDFLGRIDNQVKIRGFRIELGEIEAVLARHEGVGRCVVVAHGTSSGDKRLIAYFESQSGPAPDAAQLRAHLKQDLPDHMIPSAFVRMDRLPLTPNGKIDRKALPPPGEQRLETAGGFVEPRDPLEHSLARAWSRILKVQQIGINDDFFDLGGNSLAAVRLLFEVQQVTGKSLPLATLFQASTIAGLAEILRKDGWSPSWSSLVPIHSGGARPPLFLVHGAEGNILLYRQLTRHLDPDQPVYGLQSQGLNGEASETKIEEMAAHYVNEIVSVQPRGPYYLGGYCLGGIIALEMARQLTDHGQKVELVVLLDTYNNCYVNRSKSVLQRPRHYLENIWFHTKNALSLPWKDRWKFLREKTEVSFGRFKIRLGSGYDPKRYPHLLVQKLNDRAAEQYVPEPYGGRVALIRSRGHFSGLDNPSLGWSECIKGLEIHELPVYPKGMLVEPFCGLVAETLKKSLIAD